MLDAIDEQARGAIGLIAVSSGNGYDYGGLAQFAAARAMRYGYALNWNRRGGFLQDGTYDFISHRGLDFIFQRYDVLAFVA